MEWIIRGGGRVSIHVPAPQWVYGDEKFESLALVQVERRAIEALWAIRNQPARLASFVLEHSREHVDRELARRDAVDVDVFADTMAYVEASLPGILEPSRIDRACVPVLAWCELVYHVRRCREMRRVCEATGSPVPGILLDIEHQRIDELLAVLERPERATFGAGYDSRHGLLGEAIAYTACRPLVDQGLREGIEDLSRRAHAVLTRKPSARALVAHEKFWVIEHADALRLAEQLAVFVSDHEHLGPWLETLRRLDGVHLMSTAKWKDFVLVEGFSLKPSDLHGVLRVVPDSD